MTVRALLVLALLTVLTGCGMDSVASPPAGVDELTIPTPSPDPTDFVADVDNPWLPLEPGRTWTYDVADTAGDHPRTVTVTPGPLVDGVATPARVTTDEARVVTDYFAQDTRGNVWWFGRKGEWAAGTDGAEAGLAMLAVPRVGDGYRAAYLQGVVEDVATVTDVDGTATVPAGSYDDLVVTDDSSSLQTGTTHRRFYARGIGLVDDDAVDGAYSRVRLRSVTPTG